MEEGYTCMKGSRHSGSVSLSTHPTDGPVATYSNQPSSSYLTPASPTPSQTPQFQGYLTPVSPTPSQSSQPPAFPAGIGLNLLSHPAGARHRNQPFPRADSGIEADHPRSPTLATPSPTDTANPRASALYEYIDPKDVQVEPDQDVSREDNPRGESTSSGVSSAAPTAYSGDIISDSEEGANNVIRRRINPMYEALEQSATRLYAQTCHCKSQTSAHKQLRYLWCAFIVLIVIIVFLLCVLAYILFMLVPGLKSQVHEQVDRLFVLETGYEKLTKENQEMLKIFATNRSGSDSSMAASVLDTIIQLNNSVWTFSSQLHEISSDLQQQISNISLTPGPQGPPGVGNLSACYYTGSTTYTKLPGPSSSTSWQPSTDVLKDDIVMSATCDVIGGTRHLLEANEISPSSVQFRCLCDGSVEDSDSRGCKLHLVLCPRLFGQNSTAIP